MDVGEHAKEYPNTYLLRGCILVWMLVNMLRSTLIPISLEGAS